MSNSGQRDVHHDALLTSSSGAEGPRSHRLLDSTQPEATDAWATLSPIARGRAEPGRSVGGFTLRRVIGRGGMGVVYEAEQLALQRLVALKLIRADGVSKESIRRFELETRLLGRLKHAQIAQIYEAGVVDLGSGPQPYFAMELIEGRPLLSYAVETGADLRARLTLVAQIADAVHHAHQRQIIHRDLKPDNILITADGTPKILDFGVARAIDEQLEQTRATEIGQAIGTLPYMSPEQARGAVDEIDTRTDVYSLGVILYELVSGRRPLELRGRTFHDAVRVIVEQTPTPLSSIHRSLRGELERLVAVALAKDKEERYSSAAALATDIRRYLNDEPILVRPPPLWTKVRKFVKRNKILVGGVATLVIIGTAFGAMAGWLYQNERKSARQAQRELGLRQEYERWFDDALLLADPTPNLPLRDIIHRMATKLEASQPESEIRAQFSAKLGRTLLAIGEYERAGVLLKQAAAIQQYLNPEQRSALCVSRARLAFEAQADVKAAEDFLFEARGVDSTTAGAGTVEIWNDLGSIYFEWDRDVEASKAFALAAARQAELPGPHSGELLENDGYILVATGEFVVAEAKYRAAIAANDQSGATNRSDAAITNANLAFALAYQGQCAAASALAGEAFATQRDLNGEKHKRTAAARAAIAFASACSGDLAVAEAGYRQVLSFQQELFEPPHQAIAFTKSALAAVIAERGRADEAAQLFESAIRDYIVILGRPHRTAMWFYYGLRGQRHEARGEHDAARLAYESGKNAFAKIGGRGDQFVGHFELGLARLDAAAGDPKSALLRADDAIQKFEQSVGDDHPLTAAALGERARLRWLSDDEAGACEDLQRARAIRAALGPDIAWTQAAFSWSVWGKHPDTSPPPNCLDVRADLALLESALGADDRRVTALRTRIESMPTGP